LEKALPRKAIGDKLRMTKAVKDKGCSYGGGAKVSHLDERSWKRSAKQGGARGKTGGGGGWWGGGG